MPEHTHRAAPAHRAVGPGLLAAQRIVHVAELAATAGHVRLGWASLRQWPEWAGPDQPPLPWLRTLGACWHAAELQQCIDGARLNSLCEDLGPQTLQAVLQLDGMDLAGIDPPQTLPPAGSTGDWRDTLAAHGRSVALASMADPDLRPAVAAVLGWLEAPAHIPVALSQRWLAVAHHARG